MSRILRRPMFRGGKVSSYGKGIASGLADGGRPGYKNGQRVLDIYESVQEQIPEYQRQGLSIGDYLRIASSGLDIIGAPSEGGGIGGTLATVSKPLSKLGVDLGASIDAREAKGRERRDDLVKAVTAGEIELKGADIRSRTKQDAVKGYLDQVYELKRVAAKGDSAKLAQIESDYQKDFELFVVKGFDASDIFNVIKGDTVQEKIFDLAEQELEGLGIEESDPQYSQKIFEIARRIANEYAKSLQSSFAEGGPVAMTEDVNVMTQTPTGMTDVNMSETEVVDPTQAAPMQLTYDQLRARLPKEIGDEIVTLLANSYEALADFASIATQADVDNFNVKYGVELVLPQGA
tara:strand:- start:751 stop:1794 length:1044 start_codon:yes stop_codon:yes gene_type:complete